MWKGNAFKKITEKIKPLDDYQPSANGITVEVKSWRQTVEISPLGGGANKRKERGD